MTTTNPPPPRLADQVLELAKDAYTLGLNPAGEPVAQAPDGRQYKLATTGTLAGKRAAAPFLEQLAGLAHGAGLDAVRPGTPRSSPHRPARPRRAGPRSHRADTGHRCRARVASSRPLRRRGG